jgi:hypothetical protein
MGAYTIRLLSSRSPNIYSFEKGNESEKHPGEPAIKANVPRDRRGTDTGLTWERRYQNQNQNQNQEEREKSAPAHAGRAPRPKRKADKEHA